jgi:hypothetical protein
MKKWVLVCLCWAGCGVEGESASYATQVVSFSKGASGGFGENLLPGVVLGPPQGKGLSAGSTHVLSLGVGGSIVLGFDPCLIQNVPGPDLIVFENPFWPSGDASQVFAELGEVAVSNDGVSWVSFACDPHNPTSEGAWEGCAGWHPVLDYPKDLFPLNVAQTGGDAFDLASVGMQEARYVKITSVGTQDVLQQTPTAGFDLDAVGVVGCLQP